MRTLTGDEAANGIYVDFKCLMGRPGELPLPKLLGVLIGAGLRTIRSII